MEMNCPNEINGAVDRIGSVKRLFEFLSEDLRLKASFLSSKSTGLPLAFAPVR